MPRPPRLLLSQSYYHIMTRGNNRHIVFRNDLDYQYFLELIARYKKDHPFDLYHYCLMPNHVHLQVKTNKASDFSTFMKKLNLAYFHHFRQQYGWVGHFWQDRFKSQPIGKDEYFIQCGKYIELNPTRKGLVKNPENYIYSSYKHYSAGKIDKLITDDIFYNDLGTNNTKRQKTYSDLIVDEAVLWSYKMKAWGSGSQRYNEVQKLSRHIREKNAKSPE